MEETKEGTVAAVVAAEATGEGWSERRLRHRLQTREARGREEGCGGRQRRISVSRSSSSSTAAVHLAAAGYDATHRTNAPFKREKTEASQFSISIQLLIQLHGPPQKKTSWSAGSSPERNPLQIQTAAARRRSSPLQLPRQAAVEEASKHDARRSGQAEEDWRPGQGKSSRVAAGELP